jgi:hypothetical protein
VRLCGSCLEEIGDHNGRLVGFGWDHQSIGFAFRRFCRLLGFFGLVTGACLGPTVNLEADSAVLPLLLVFVTSLSVGVSVTGPGVGWD